MVRLTPDDNTLMLRRLLELKIRLLIRTLAVGIGATIFSAYAEQLHAQAYRGVAGIRIRAMAPTPTSEMGDIVSAVQLTSGIFVVADNINRQLHFYGAGGRFVRSVGAPGDGPGEFRAIRWIGECGRDSVYVLDTTLQRMSVFAPDGKFVRSFPPAAINVAQFRCTIDGTVAYLIESTQRANMSQWGVIQTVDHTGKLLYRSPEMMMIEGRPLGKQIAVAIAAEGLIFGNGDNASLTMMSVKGEGPHVLAAGTIGREPTDTNRAASLEYWATLIRGTSVDYERMRQMLRKLPPVKTLAPYNDVFIDVITKAIWVKTSNLGDPATILERLTFDGVPQGRATLLPDLEIQQIRGDVVVAKLSAAKTAEQLLVTYRLIK